MKTKTFDCVQMMRDIRNKVNEEWKNMTAEQIITLLNQKYPNFSKKN